LVFASLRYSTGVDKMNKNELIAVEDYLREVWEAGNIHNPHHFCGGNEDQLIEYFERVKPDDWVFSTWRNAYHYLLKTGDVEFLLNKIIIENNSMHIIDIPRKFIASAIVGGNVAMAVGTAYAIKLRGGTEHVHCFIGDGSCDQGWTTEALRYAIGQDLPITFIVENNNRSVCTDIKTRWGDKDTFMEGMRFAKKVYYYEYEAVYPHVGTHKRIQFL
jgi:pyruvate dehydrogenase E1 component alpha subunit